MANTRVLETTRGIEDTTRTRKSVVEDIIPSSTWTEDSNGHYLMVDLPDFKKQEVKVQVINSGLIKVSGNRGINDNKSINFEQTFKLGKNSDVDNITAKFDVDILYVTVPKLIVDRPASRNNHDNATYKIQGQENPTIRSFSEETIRKWEGTTVEENNYLRSAVELFSKNKEIVATAIIAFSLGLLVSRKLKSNGD